MIFCEDYNLMEWIIIMYYIMFDCSLLKRYDCLFKWFTKYLQNLISDGNTWALAFIFPNCSSII